MSTEQLNYRSHRYKSLEFITKSPLNEAQVHFEFKGVFQNKPVIWDATLSALNSEAESDKSPANKHIQVITIEHLNEERFKIDIHLDVKLITEATVFKTILMIHNYKRLKIGQHEFGQSYASAKKS